MGRVNWNKNIFMEKMCVSLRLKINGLNNIPTISAERTLENSLFIA